MYGMMRPKCKTPSKNQKKKTKMFNKGDAVSVLDGASMEVIFDQRRLPLKRRMDL
jgi:hypothetical protein